MTFLSKRRYVHGFKTIIFGFLLLWRMSRKIISAQHFSRSLIVVAALPQKLAEISLLVLPKQFMWKERCTFISNVMRVTTGLAGCGIGNLSAVVRLCGQGMAAMSVKESEACQIYPLSPLSDVRLIPTFLFSSFVQKPQITEDRGHIYFRKKVQHFLSWET